MNHRLYRENRSRMTYEDLREYQGQWMAFSSDGARILASGPTLLELDARLVSAGVDPQEVAFESIELEDISLGGAGLLA